MQATKHNVKAGDKVRVIQPRQEHSLDTHGQLLKDSIHTVRNVTYGLELVGPDHSTYAYNFERFEVVQPVVLQKGDKVRVVRKVGSFDQNGMGAGRKWAAMWQKEMDAAIGNVYKIEKLEGDHGYRLEVCGEQWNYPLEALELVEDVIPGFNGVDAIGRPKNFTVADLEALQRVVLRDGSKGIIAESVAHHGTCVVYPDNKGFDKARIDSNIYLDILEVYENPGYGNTYNQEKRGPLLWQSVDAARIAAQKAADAAIVAAETAAAEAAVALEAAKAARAAL